LYSVELEFGSSLAERVSSELLSVSAHLQPTKPKIFLVEKINSYLIFIKYFFKKKILNNFSSLNFTSILTLTRIFLPFILKAGEMIFGTLSETFKWSFIF
jgi:hypothetical protein